MSMDDLMAEGKAFVRDNLAGYDALIAVHRDTDNDHIHIVINSVRAMQREQQPWMMRDKHGEILSCEMEAGGKHQDSPQFKAHRNDWLMEYTRQHGLTVKDNNAIAAQRRAERYGKKNEEMKAAILNAASQSKDMKELQRILREKYKMELKIRGSTISVQHPDSAKAVRLRTLGLDPAEITRRLSGEEYTYDRAAEQQQLREEVEAKERKKYIDWIRDRRQANNEKAEDAIARAEEILAQRLRGRGEKYSRQDFRDLNYLIRQASYLEAALQTEKEKLDRLMERWEQSQDPGLSDRERRQHANYVRWCGCEPNSTYAVLEFASLKNERTIIESQQECSKAMGEALMAQAERWKGRNELTYSENDLAWKKQREQQLKQQLKYVKANRKKLWEISCNCEKAAVKYGGRERMEKFYAMREKWADLCEKEEEIKRKLYEIKQEKSASRAKVRQAKKQLSEIEK